MWNNLLKSAKAFFNFLFNYFFDITREINRDRKGISYKNVAEDTLAVVSSTGMLLVLNAVALVVFLFLPQGKDVIFIVVEDLIGWKVGSMVWLLIGLVLWSYVSEFASRYSVYVSDNSGVGLTEERVRLRKDLQRAMSSIFLVLPFFIVLASLALDYFQDDTLSKGDKDRGFGIAAGAVYLLLNGVAYIYFGDTRKPKPGNLADSKSNAPVNDSNNDNDGENTSDEGRSIISILQKAKQLNERERRWAEKLYGIYNDYVFNLRKPDNFRDEPKEVMDIFADFVVQHNIKTNLPQDSNYMGEGAIVPAEFRLKAFSTEDDKADGRFRWVYFIPNSFYRELHAQLGWTVGLCSLLFLGITFLPVQAYINIGSPALIVIAFSCWTALYMGVLFLDYAVFRGQYTFLKEPEVVKTVEIKIEGRYVKVTNDKWYKLTPIGNVINKISLRFWLAVLLLFSSWINSDHPVRYNTNGACCDNRPLLKDHFRQWLKEYVSDSAKTEFITRDSCQRFFPVVFVCAEGGALRTGAFTALLLSHFEDTIKADLGLDFRRAIYAYSGVSGGALGVGFFNAEANLNRRNELMVGDSLISGAKEFFARDFLASVVGKMFYGDILNLFFPWHVEHLDRAIALEEAWEDAYSKVVNSGGRNCFSADYHNIYSNSSKTSPALFVNTTEVETGLQCWLCNVRPDSDMYRWGHRDLLKYRIRGGINYSTMINFSSRFPIFSPAATIIESSGQKFHYVDGGYTENSGAGTMEEIIESLKPFLKDNDILPKGTIIKPYVIEIEFSEGRKEHQNINFCNEISEILYGIINTRSGRTETARAALRKTVEDELHGKVISIPLEMSNSQVPMNWTLSDRSVDNVLKAIRNQYRGRPFKQFFLRDTQYCRLCNKVVRCKCDSLVKAYKAAQLIKECNRLKSFCAECDTINTTGKQSETPIANHNPAIPQNK